MDPHTVFSCQISSLEADLFAGDLAAILGEDGCAFQHMGQFAYIARPVVLHQTFCCARGEPLDRHLLAQPIQQILRQRKNVFHVGAQRWH